MQRISKIVWTAVCSFLALAINAVSAEERPAVTSAAIPPFGKIQPLVLKSEATRVQLAEEVNGFVKGIQERHANAPVVVVGDMNDFEFSKPMQALKGDVMKEMLETVPQENRYTYIHEGNAQVLDHIFVTNNIAPHTIVDPVHLNTNVMEEDGRMSDHDPVLAQIELKKAS